MFRRTLPPQMDPVLLAKVAVPVQTLMWWTSLEELWSQDHPERKDVQPSTSKEAEVVIIKVSLKRGALNGTEDGYILPEVSSPSVASLDHKDLRLRGAVYFGYGLLNIIVSLIPPKLMKVANLFGFHGSRRVRGASGAGILQQQSGCQGTPCKDSPTLVPHYCEAVLYPRWGTGGRWCYRSREAA